MANVEGPIALEAGRAARVAALHQYFFYSHHYEGVFKSEDILRRRMSGQLARVAAYGGAFANPHVLWPEAGTIEHEAVTEGRFPRGAITEFYYPRVLCVARFVCPAASVESVPTEMAVAWMQDELAMPIEEAILARIQALDWDALAQPVHQG